MSPLASRLTGLRTTLLPPLAGISVMLLMLGVLQAPHITAQLRYQQAQNNTETIESNSLHSAQPHTISIPSLDITAPVIYEAATEDETLFQTLLQSGVVHYPFTATPDQTGNVVLFGHSSGSWLAPGNYKSVFAKLDILQRGDIIRIAYRDELYTYKVTSSQIVRPTDVSVLQPTEDRRLTLITCYPVGSNAKRLIVTAQ